MGISTDTDQDKLERQKTETDPSPPQGPSFPVSDKLLEEVARSAHHLTGAGGAALALSDGKTFSCRASCGYLTPPVGTCLDVQSGLTAICIRTADAVRCDDTHADPRVDRSRCGDIRSIAAVPVFNGPTVLGILAVFSSRAGTFTGKHEAVLQLLARVVEAQLGYASPPNPSPLAPATPASGAASVPPQVGCLSCGQRNPQGSQFCNRCGVILSSSAPSPYGSDLSLVTSLPPLDREGLQQVYKLIAGDSGLATWSDIYAKLMANLESSALPNKPVPVTTAESDRKKEVPQRFGKPGLKNDLSA